MNEVANKKSDREVWIDIVKGIAIVMVVWQHTCQRTKTYFSLEDDPLLNFLNLIVADVNMPIFFAISGYVYFLKREKYLGDIRRFIKTRFYDLIIPYLIFGPMIWLGKFLLTAFVRDPMTINDLFRMFYVPIAFMWFIYVLFFIEVITILLDKFAKGKELLVLGFMLIPSFFIAQGKTAVSLTLTFLFWYYSGSLILLAKNRISPPIAKFRVLFLIVSFILWMACFASNIYYQVPYMIIAERAWAVVFFISLCYNWNTDTKIKKLLNYLGACSMYIYILNPLIINGLRQIMVRLGVDNLYVSFIVFFFVTIAIACGIREIAKRVPPLEFIFSPRKYLIKK